MTTYSTIDYNGGSGTYAVPFSFIDPTHVQVYDNGTLYSGVVTWGTGSISLSPDIAAGHTVTIARSTPKSPLVVFTPGALNSIDMNLSVTQLIYLLQEAIDAIAGGNASNVTGATNFKSLPSYVDDDDAKAHGLVAGKAYFNGSSLQVVQP